MAAIRDTETPRPAVTKLDPQYRVALPREVREKAAIEAGAELILIVEGRGRVTLATRDAIVEELHGTFAGKPGTRELLQQREWEAEADHESWERKGLSA
jgi:bifunctional DNA-binding transcriptional regulator/antitoxin component of YhaV-PrlF toxin-antitoxin module